MRFSKVLLALTILLAAAEFLSAQAQVDPTNAKQLFEQERWSDLAQLLQPTARNSADLDYYYGVALAHLERWAEAGKALSAGQRLAPRDKRFPIELAGVAFKQKKYGEAKKYLHRALQLDPKDEYANEFLATIYFLQGNLEAALKYWNRVGKPQVAEVPSEPGLKIRPALLDHAFAFAPASTLTLNELLASNVRLRGLEMLVIDALQYNTHPSHLSLGQALGWIEKLTPKQAVLTHMHVPLDYATVKAEVPANVTPAYDGMMIEIPYESS